MGYVGTPDEKSIGYGRTIVHLGVNQNVAAHADVLMSVFQKTTFELLAEICECV